MILVTGGTGFLGSYILQELLKSGRQVRALRRNQQLPAFLPPALQQQVEWAEGDILDVLSLEEAMKGVTAIIHAAAVVSFRRSDYARMYKINVEGTANVVNMALEAGVPRLVHISSVAAIGRSERDELLTENSKWDEEHPQTAYARSKHRAELEVWRGWGEGLQAVILNPSTILGYGDWSRGSCAIFKNAYDEFPWYTEGMNGFVDVEDVARAAVQLLDSPVNGERFIVSGENLVFRDLFNLMADHLGKKRPSRKATPFLGELAWRMEKLKSFFNKRAPLLTRDTARIARSKTRFSNEKLLRTLPGFQFTPLVETISKAAPRYLALASTKP